MAVSCGPLRRVTGAGFWEAGPVLQFVKPGAGFCKAGPVLFLWISLVAGPGPVASQADDTHDKHSHQDQEPLRFGEVCRPPKQGVERVLHVIPHDGSPPDGSSPHGSCIPGRSIPLKSSSRPPTRSRNIPPNRPSLPKKDRHNRHALIEDRTYIDPDQRVGPAGPRRPRRLGANCQARPRCVGTARWGDRSSRKSHPHAAPPTVPDHACPFLDPLPSCSSCPSWFLPTSCSGKRGQLTLDTLGTVAPAGSVGDVVARRPDQKPPQGGTTNSSAQRRPGKSC